MRSVIIMLIISCSKNNFIYDNKYKNDIKYCFNNLHKLNTNNISWIIEKAKKGDNKALFLYIYLLEMYPNNEHLKSKAELLESTNNLIRYLFNNNEFLALGLLYSKGIRGHLGLNANEAIKYYNKTTDIGNFKTAYYLGLLY